MTVICVTDYWKHKEYYNGMNFFYIIWEKLFCKRIYRYLKSDSNGVALS